MAYFHFSNNCKHYPNEWDELLNYIKNELPKNYAVRLQDLEFHVEAKALYVMTLARHLIERAEELPRNGNWKPVFIEASILLFPMIELVGQARLGGNIGSSFGSGLDWLAFPNCYPRGRTTEDLKSDEDRIENIGGFMSTLPGGPRFRELFHIRNYFIHGLKNQHDPNFDIGAVRSSMNYELPFAITQCAKKSLSAYWSQLSQMDGASQEWITRLADADIYPFGIMGSVVYEKGLVDYNIIDWLRRLDGTG